MKNNEGHVTSVSPIMVFGGYGVKCKTCGNVGRGIGKGKTKAEIKKSAKAAAQKIASEHRRMGSLPEFKYGPFGF